VLFVDWKNGITVSGSTITVDCWVKGAIGEATKAKVVAELQEKNGQKWTTIETWTATKNSYKASVYESKTVAKGNTYRVKATVTIWEGSQSESQVVYSAEKSV